MDVDLGAGQRVSLRPVDPSALGAAGRVDALVALQQLRSWVDAQEQVLLAAMAEPGDPPRPGRPDPVASGKQFVREEIACALTISGPTNPRNLESLCARHHALKHQAGWTVRGDSADERNHADGDDGHGGGVHRADAA